MDVRRSLQAVGKGTRIRGQEAKSAKRGTSGNEKHRGLHQLGD